SSTFQLPSILRTYLVTKLPEYMVPAAFVQLDSFPLTPNGKLDRKALPAPGDNAFALQTYEEPSGEIENMLSSIWSELLNVERVGRNDSFFTLGGHSILAVRMIARIRASLGFALSLRTVFEAPTIAELAPRLLAAGVTQDESYDVLLPINPRGSKPPLFCIHPGIGLSWCFTRLSMRLGPDQPLYGLQARGFIGDGKMAATIDEMVLDYIAQVRRIQPQGPYHLLGYSFGGLVAHTMASYLEEQGECVALVALMDTRAHIQGQERPIPDEDKGEDGNLNALFVGNKDQSLTNMMRPFLDKTVMILRNSSKLMRARVLRVIKSDLLIFRATVLSNEAKLLSPDDWRPYVVGNIDVYDVECEHTRMDLPEPTAIIGQVLSEKLNQLHWQAQNEQQLERGKET
ncbi:hypothetical protein BGX28_007984, partial [Mortierella sp. GBA30]